MGRCSSSAIESLILVKAYSWVTLDEVEVNLMSKEFSNIRHSIPTKLLVGLCKEKECTHLIMVGLSRDKPQP